MSPSDDPDQPIEVVPQPISNAFGGLLEHAIRFGSDDPRHQRKTIEAYLTLASSVETLRLSFPLGMDKLESLLDAVESAARRP